MMLLLSQKIWIFSFEPVELYRTSANALFVKGRTLYETNRSSILGKMLVYSYVETRCVKRDTCR